jgi:tricorn protease
VEPVVIELAGFERRAIPLPVDKGSFTHLAVNREGQLLYVRRALRGSDSKSALKILDVLDSEKDDQDEKKREEKTVLADVGAFIMSADGRKIMAAKGGDFTIVTAAAEQKFEKPLKLGGMTTTIDPREEWRQLFRESWRIQRDFFYDPNMHGVDWPKMQEHYAQMIEDCASREDVTFVIGELISELNVGHAYARSGGDLEETPNVSVGMLGVDFELHDGAYRIARICEGAPWDVDARGPLSEPGVEVKEGDYVLAVNSVPVDTKRDPWAAFLGLAGEVVTLTVSEKPQLDDAARDVVVKLLDGEGNLRYRAFIERNRSHVAKKTDGRVGYIYVPNTGINGQNDLFRQFYGQLHTQALIIDERWNGGGQIPTRFIELLNRPVTNYWAVRNGRDWQWPPDSHQGPKCMLINGLAGSGGDCFPYYFRQRNIGKLIGLRTWGGLVGISGNPTLIDGGRITAPTFAFYELDGTWGVEGHGVDPDIEVVDDPALMVNGDDPQLDAAIKHLLEELDRNPFEPPARPKYPDRSGMGLSESDK